MKSEKNRRKSAMAILFAVAMIASISVVISPVIANNNAPSGRPLPPTTSPAISLAPGYCPSYGGSHLYENIQSVSYDRKSEETLTITVNIWIANPDGCVAGEPCPVYDDSPEYINAWIDWDGDGVFESDERVLDAALTGYLGINYHGTMSTSNIVTIPADAVSSTWMRVNLGWDHDPNDPCEESWPWGDVVDKEIQVQVVEPPKIEEIIITPKNPMTRNDVTFEAIITDVPEFEVWSINWIVTGVGNILPDFFDIGNKNPYTHKPAAGTHGKKIVFCIITYKNKATGAIGMDYESKDFKLFFEKGSLLTNWADDGKPGGPNWFKYWKRDGAVPGMADAKYDATEPGYGGASGNQVYLYKKAASQHYHTAYEFDTYFGHPERFGGPSVTGIDCAAEVVAHELYHVWVTDQWKFGRSFHGKTDSDKDLPDHNDRLPDFYESGTSHTRNDNTDTYNVGGKKHPDYKKYGDEEYMAMRAGNTGRGDKSKDWANPGKQTKGVISHTSDFSVFTASHLQRQNILQTEFTGSYSDHGTDTNGNSLYDYLTVIADVNITTSGYYDIVGWLNNTNGDMVGLINNPYYFEAGINSVEFNFDGLMIHHYGTNGPYSLSLILSSEFGHKIDSQYDVYDTSAYCYTDFEGQQIGFTSSYSDYGTDTDGDGIYDYLTVEVEITATIAGDYTIDGYLYGDDGDAIVFASTSTYLGIGTQTIVLNFDGLSIAQSKQDGPYTLSYLTLYDENDTPINFIYDAYNTPAYSYTDFQSPTASFRDIYSDYGMDTDSDGLYNYLTTEAEVSVLVPGTYTILGWLSDSSEESDIIWDSGDFYLDAGVQSMQLNFDGMAIYTHGTDGPYTLSYLALSDENGNLVDYRHDAYTTSAYSYTDFQKPEGLLVELTGNYNDYATDIDGDGVFDYLTVDAEVLLANPGYCIIKARLMDINGEEIVWAENTAYLEADTPQIIQLNFDGTAIYNHGVNGPYYLRDVYIYHTGDPYQPDYVYDAYTTAPYSYTEFGKMCGDVNCDGKVTMSDVRKVFNRYLDPNYPLDSPWAADVNCDGKVTMSDVRKVFNRYLDPGYELNCCCEV